MEPIRAIYECEMILEKLPETISKSGYKKEFLINKLGITNAGFYRKLKNKRFSINELKIIFKVLFPHEYHEHQLWVALEEGLKDIKEGRTASHEEIKQELRRKFSLNV